MYKLELLEEEGKKVAKIYFMREELRKRFKTPMAYTYNGIYWIKTSGGKGIFSSKLADVLKPEDMEKIKQHFNL
ncbi:MAG: hypothetical protein ACTSV7_09040 [Candidatus Baldrarchaeia archaeon]